ncbi:hypothetical protein PSHT_04158 [Puccinia striiformis]|uniref:Uncharacterized protein n=1 Tax=Puccinia striiformis TaxID=27350 RepID=A0A2S4WE25_9BASI|nr:hypothetical protein PSHT_04158 [Puccinia striiformis]
MDWPVFIGEAASTLAAGGAVVQAFVESLFASAGAAAGGAAPAVAGAAAAGAAAAAAVAGAAAFEDPLDSSISFKLAIGSDLQKVSSAEFPY